MVLGVDMDSFLLAKTCRWGICCGGQPMPAARLEGLFCWWFSIIFQPIFIQFTIINQAFSDISHPIFHPMFSSPTNHFPHFPSNLPSNGHHQPTMSPYFPSTSHPVYHHQPTIFHIFHLSLATLPLPTNHLWLRNVLRATAACTFLMASLPRVLRTWSGFNILTSECALRHSRMQFLNFPTSKSAPGVGCFYLSLFSIQSSIQCSSPTSNLSYIFHLIFI